MKINYNHSHNPHGATGPAKAVPYLLSRFKPTSVLDIGCGTGTWLSAFNSHGIEDYLGIDGVNVHEDDLHISKDNFQQQDLTQAWNLNRKFDLAVCFEVAEHLPQKSAFGLVQSITQHADVVFFSAAIPGQRGQNHVNCQWPEFWQKYFNDCGFVCSDSIRLEMWNNNEIDVWYRQNIFEARYNPEQAGKEVRIRPLIHPEIIPSFFKHHRNDVIEEIVRGYMSPLWYPRAMLQALIFKFSRKVIFH